MRLTRRAGGLAVVLVAWGLGVPAPGRSAQAPDTGQAAARYPRNAEQYDELFRQVSNWAGGAPTMSSAP